MQQNVDDMYKSEYRGGGEKTGDSTMGWDTSWLFIGVLDFP